MPVTHALPVPAYIEKARVLDVDTRYWILSVATEFTRKPLTGVPFSSPYQHFVNGEGVYFMPEVGSLVWLCTPSDGSMPFVIAWASASSEGDYRANKMDLNPGDMYLGTRDENFIFLRRGGVVQIGATPLAQRIFLPVDNTIRDFCQNYELHTLGGDLTWTVDIPEKTPNGTRPTTFKLSARQYADDEGPVATLEIGSHDGDPNAILSLVLKSSGDGGDSVITMKMTKAGEVSWTAKGRVAWEFEDEFTMDVTGNATITSKKTTKVVGDTSVEIEGGLVKITGKKGPVTITGVPIVNVGPQLAVGGAIGGGGAPAMRASPATLTWLMTHRHFIAQLNATTEGVVDPFPADAVSKDLTTS